MYKFSTYKLLQIVATAGQLLFSRLDFECILRAFCHEQDFESNSNNFWILLDIFRLTWLILDIFGSILAISLLLLAVGFGSMNQVPSRLRIICRSALSAYLLCDNIVIEP